MEILENGRPLTGRQTWASAAHPRSIIFIACSE
jgi:hypothetical protein